MVRRQARTAAALTTIVLVASLASCAVAPTLPSRGGVTATSSPAGPGGAVELGASARTRMEALANGIGDRYSGTPAEKRAGDYIEAAFTRMGYSVEEQTFQFGRREASSRNLVATKQGSSTREIVVGAHYDSVQAGQGADDNASGVGVLLAAAESVRDVETPYTIRFVAFGAEESDLDGSGYFVEQLDPAERANIVAMVNLDSVSAGDIPYVYGDAAEVRDWVRTAAAETGQRMDTVPVGNLHRDADYYPFQRAGIPFIYFEATNWGLGRRDGFTQVNPKFADEGGIIHTQYDTIKYLDSTFPGRIDERLNLYATVLVRLLEEYQA